MFRSLQRHKKKKHTISHLTGISDLAASCLLIRNRRCVVVVVEEEEEEEDEGEEGASSWFMSLA